MIGFLIGLVVGIGACEYAGRKLSGYSVAMETVEWCKRLGYPSSYQVEPVCKDAPRHMQVLDYQ